MVGLHAQIGGTLLLVTWNHVMKTTTSAAVVTQVRNHFALIMACMLSCSREHA